MAQIKQFRLPDAGEGLTEAEIISWKVQPGDRVSVNDAIVEIETAKSLVELPCPFAGVVTEILVPAGTTVDVGTPIIAVDVDPDGAQPVPDASPAMAAPESAAAPAVRAGAPAVAPGVVERVVEHGLIGGEAPGGRMAVLVGYGPKTTTATRRARAAQPSPVMHAGYESPEQTTVPVARPLAKPPVRKLARDLGVSLAGVTPSGLGGVVTREDVEAAAAAQTPTTHISGDRETRIPIKGVRKLTAEAMVASAFTAPHVTEWVQVDVTRTMKLVGRLREDREFADVKVSPLLVVSKALLLAVRRNPGINATWDAAAGEIVLKGYVNLGLAAATPRGLVVPNIKDADRLTLHDLAEAIGELTVTAREGRTPPSDMAGGTITITNVGVFGVDGGTPILNPGEAAILCLGQVRRQPWVHRGRVVPRWVTQLAVSFDHRLVDGDLGSRFLADVAAVLEHPSKALAWA